MNDRALCDELPTAGGEPTCAPAPGLTPGEAATERCSPECFGPCGVYGTLTNFKASLNALIKRRKLGHRTTRPVLALWLAFCVSWAVQGAEQASWYGEQHRGLPMANTQPFNPDRLTCASWFHPLGTRLRVSHAGRSVVVTVTDRGPAWRLVRQGRTLDLSRAAFARLAPPARGLLTIDRLEVLP